jgi:glycosyltransferase involved in cell wall biosynthesis
LVLLARDWQADLLHLNLPSQAAELCTDLPVVVVAHSCVPTWWKALRGNGLPATWRWQWQRNRQGFDRADAVIVPSVSHGSALGYVYGALPNLRVIHNATRIRPTVTLEREHFILSAGRWWDEGKNGIVLDKAAVATSWPVMMAGPLDGPNGEQVLFRNAHATGSLSSGEVLALMGRAAIFAAPSRYEPFGLAVLEAALSGAALVLADIPSFRELWSGAAVFVPPTAPAAWAEALNLLIANPVHRRELAEQALHRAKEFTPKRQLDGILATYGTVMAGRMPEKTEAV